MPIIRIDNAGQYGLITDVNQHSLPPNAWTAGVNVRFANGKVEKFKGHQEYFDPGSSWDGGTGSIVYYLLPVANGANYYWIYCGLNDVRVTDGSTDVEITNSGGDYSGTAAKNWTGGIITGIPVLNNGVDVPQMWNPVDFGIPGLLTDLTGFAARADKCGALRVYKNYLIALDVTKSGTRYPQMVKWSDSAGIGAVPTSWDETDPTTDAGENDLAENRTNTNVGVALDCLQLRDANIVYTDSSVWSMQFIGGSNIFQFRELFPNIGMLTKRCAAEFEGKHFVIGQGDIYVHNGSSYDSVVDSRRRDAIYDNIDPDHYEKTFVFPNYAEKEMWVCFSEAGNNSQLPNIAHVWNWQYNTWGIRELPNNNVAVGSGGYGTTHIESGVADTSAGTDTYDTLPYTFDTWITTFGEIGYNPQIHSPVMAADKLYKADETEQFDGTNITSLVERTGIPLGVPDEGVQDDMVRIKRIYPRISGSGTVNVYVGSQLTPNSAVDYGQAVAFTPGTSRKVDVRKTGSYAATKFESTGNQSWELSGYDIEFEFTGKR